MNLLFNIATYDACALRPFGHGLCTVAPTLRDRNEAATHHD
jgi:hypothetical protein